MEIPQCSAPSQLVQERTDVHPRARKGRAAVKNLGVDLYSTAGIRSAVFHNPSLYTPLSAMATAQRLSLAVPPA